MPQATTTRSGRMQPAGSRLIKFFFGEELPFVSHGRGVFVYDTDGRRYLDGCSGAVTANLGHSDPEILRALHEQAERITFAHRGTFHSEQSEALAERLGAMTGYPYVFLCNSGSEAVETALRLTLQYWRERGEPNRSQFASHAVSYHGATLGGLSLSGHPQRRRVAEALLHEFNELTPPYAYRFAEGRDDAEFTELLVNHTAEVLDAHGPAAAGVVVEPVGGAAGGAITPPDGYLQALAGLCRERGLPLIADEVMTGMGRTGMMLASQHWDVRPDLVVLGKGMGAGYAPVSAVLVSEEIIDAIAAGTASVTNGHTYGGNPLGSAVALAVLEAIESRGLVANAAERGKQLRAGLEALARRHEVIGEVRGLGLLQGLELVSDRVARSPGAPIGSLTRAATFAARDQGLLVYPATGGINNAILVAPPLTVTAEEIDLLLELLDASFTSLTSEESTLL
ncbi:aminotransferase class III-fold pyridoxal phosphate-dependent enzyme [Streptomyces coffeae]|uniref:Aminotransferase class III-fold pyridoxal phosphate-dependent enzyme n=1 Tax=Streptomyces coffeae TaxID=621382 RepID=A0ABS1NPT1_9ACTN|nr:aminotransferase class III-fold pyridoxal phosphate-dependent enzyme [Streptomyces coffeae]MBL1102078.1 aminotransferase class III-fold pyridoxal phosphate-dependent enzyme [Streptomyces coffeae]